MRDVLSHPPLGPLPSREGNKEGTHYEGAGIMDVPTVR
jgi:hypothetical protein